MVGSRRSGRPHRRFEAALRRKGYSVAAGVDEAGRGCIAGPVVAAAVVLPVRVPPGLDDSKRLTPQRRSRLLELLREAGAAIGIAAIGPGTIDRINIREASFEAMRRAIAHLPSPPEVLLVDGFEIPGLEIPQRALVKGDQRCLSVAAASIVAKVCRDEMMIALGQRFPEYGFEVHKGYPTRAHLEAVARHGPLPVHRLSFTPVRRLATVSGARPRPVAG